MRNSLLSACSLLAVTFAIGQGTHAQSIDYGSLESLYGEPITTGASGTPQTASNVATNMTIITADQIRQNGSRSIPQILGRVPGLDILQETSTGYDVGVRGYQQAMQPSLLVLIDGRQVFSDDYSRTIWENLPVNVDDIRQIEVVMGPASALFGSNAAHGVINIITYNPLYDDNNVAAVSYGTQKDKRADATVMTKIGDWGSAKISAGGNNAAEFNTPRITFVGIPEDSVVVNPQERYVVESNVFRLGTDLQASTEFTYAKSTGTEAYYDGQLAGTTDTTYSVRGGLSWQSPIGTITSNNYLNHAKVDNSEISFTLKHYSDTTTAYTSQLSDQFKIGSDNTGRISLEYNKKDFTFDGAQTVTSPTLPVANSSIQENNYAVGGMWLWQISGPLSWTNAARLDHMVLSESGQLLATQSAAAFNHTLNEVSANSGLVYQASPEDSFRATYARGVEMPSLLDYGENDYHIGALFGAPFAIERVGNPLLKATVSSNYELGYDRKLPALMSTVRTSVYYEQNSDIISPFDQLQPVTVGKLKGVYVYESINIGNSRGFGGEIKLFGSSPSGFRWDASYSYAKANDDSTVLSPPSGGPTPSNSFGYQESAPAHHLRALLGYSIEGWEFDINGQYLTQRDILRSYARTTSPGYFSLGARVGYTITDGLVLDVSGTNVDQAKQVESPYPAVERQILGTITAKF